MPITNSLLFVAVLVVLCVTLCGCTIDAMSVTFNNGSTLVLYASYFTGSWQGMQQNGLAPGQHDWEMSLVDPSTFNGNSPSALYMAMGKNCDKAKFGTAAYSATPNSDGSGVQIIFKAFNSGKPWQASLDIVCDPTQNTLFSPTNAYTASQYSTDIIVAWTLKSKGACLGVGPAPPPPPTVTFNNGSVLVLNNTYFKNTFIEMRQIGLVSSYYNFELSLATPDTFNHLCSTPVYLGKGSQCNQTKFKNAPSATPNNDGSGVQLIYLDTDPFKQKWQATVNIICDPSRDKIYSPSNSFDAAQPTDTIVLTFFLTSMGACLSSNPAPVPTPPPSPSPSFNRRVTFANGSSVLLNKFFFMGNFPQMVEKGLAPGKNDIHMSLVSPSTFDNICRNASYVSINKCTGVLFDTAPLYVVPNSAQSGIEFVFQGTSQSGFGFQANINVVCDLSRNELTSPTNSYHAAAPASKIILTWEMSSRGACVDQN